MTTGPETTSAAREPRLTGQVVGVSISDSEDLRRRGFLPVHVDRALAEVATLTAAAGARIGYGGHLESGGFTRKLFRAVSELYGRRAIATSTPPCIHYLAAPVWRKLSPSQLFAHVRELGGAVEVVLVDFDGHARSLRLLDDPSPGSVPAAVHFATRRPRRLNGAGLLPDAPYRHIRKWWSDVGVRPPIARESPPPADHPGASVGDRLIDSVTISDPSELAGVLDRPKRSPPSDGPPPDSDADATAFSMMRLFMSADEDARVVLGGKTRGYAGHFPGIAEETLYGLLAGNPVVGLGCFGGCADDVVRTLLSGAPPDRPGVGAGNATILRALAAGSDVFREALEEAGLAALYPEVAALDSFRAMAIGVVRCLERREWYDAWRRRADAFRSATLEGPA